MNQWGGSYGGKGSGFDQSYNRPITGRASWHPGNRNQHQDYRDPYQGMHSSKDNSRPRPWHEDMSDYVPFRAWVDNISAWTRLTMIPENVQGIAVMHELRGLVDGGPLSHNPHEQLIALE